MLLSVVIPAHNEAGCIASTVEGLVLTLRREDIPHEVVVVDDGSTDSTPEILRELRARRSGLKIVTNTGEHGFGMAIRAGLDHCTGDAIALMMADASDDPEDLVVYYRKIEEGCECAFGSRFVRGGRVIDYPVHKLLLNRL